MHYSSSALLLFIIKALFPNFLSGKAHIPNIHALNSDSHTFFLSILILNSQCVGVAIEGMDILYMDLISDSVSIRQVKSNFFKFYLIHKKAILATFH